MTDRRRRAISPKLRRSIIAANGGVCPACGEESKVWEVDHIRPVALDGDNSRDNLVAICPECHLEKTVQDIKRIAKVKRLEAKRLGTKTKRWKRKIGGGTVYE